jgi:hypothetical protein
MKSLGNHFPYMRLLSQVHTREYGCGCHWFTCLLHCESIEHWCLMCDPLNFTFLCTCYPSLLSHHLFWLGVSTKCQGWHIPAVSTIFDLISFVHHIIKLRFYICYLNKFLCDYCNREIHLIWRMDLNFWGPLWEACFEYIKSSMFMFVT